MSWAEVKKFLNKRNDKSLDEIICDEIVKSKKYATNYESVSLAEKNSTYGTGYDADLINIQGSGRIHVLYINQYVAQTKTAAVEVFVDGVKIWSFEHDDTNTTSGASNATHQIVFFAFNPDKLNFYNDNTGHIEVLTPSGLKTVLTKTDSVVFYNGEPITKTTSGTSSQSNKIALMDDLVFSESLVVKLKNAATNKTPNGWILYSLDE